MAYTHCDSRVAQAGRARRASRRRLLPAAAPMIAAAGIGLLALQGSAAFAQSWTGSGETIDDLRYRVDILAAELGDIRQRLAGADDVPSQVPPAGSGGPVSSETLIRLDRLEAELRRLTGAVERLEFQQGRIAEDGGQRLGDIEFRLTELEGGDIAALGPPRPLGAAPGAAPAPQPQAADPTPTPAPTPAPTPEAAPEAAGGGTFQLGAQPAPPAGSDDQVDLALAIQDVQQGRFDQGQERLARLLETDLPAQEAARARYWLGQSYFIRGNFREAARLYLAGYNTSQTGDMAPRNLLQLGVTLGRLGQTREACLTLREVRNQFPSGYGQVLTAADVEADNLACGGE